MISVTSYVQTRLIAVLLTGVIAFGLAEAQAQAGDEGGEHLYISKGCLGCHGASARGGGGVPSLAQTELPFNQFLAMLRTPKTAMHTFPKEVVKHDEAVLIHDYLRTLPLATPRIGLEAPTGKLPPSSCAECHLRYQATIVRQFQGSAMGRPGAQNPAVDNPVKMLTCANCHGTDHTKITASAGRVPETTCGGCHPKIYQEHVVDLGHSYGPGPADIGPNWERNIGVPHYAQMPRKVMEMGCDPCHAQAGATAAEYWDDEQKKYIDTSSLRYRNGCMACHTRHAFSLNEARKPEACYTCHMGPDHPNYEAYMSSKHGSIYAARGSDWDWNQRLADAEWDVPTCAYCHMLYVDEDGNRYSSHNMTRKIIWGMGVQAALGELADITVTEENQAKRNEMVKVCMTCHSESLARGYLESADAHKLAGDALVVEARKILGELYDEGLIDPIRGPRSAGLLPGPEFSAIELPRSEAMHWPAGLFYDVSTAELEYFDMFFFSNLKSYKGAFHMSPDYAWWYGYAEVLSHLARLRDEAKRLRAAKRSQYRTTTLFIISTGILLLGVGLVYGIMRRRTRQRSDKQTA